MNKEVFDVDDFLERVGDDKELLVELLGIFEQDYGGKRKQLGAAVQKKNTEEIKNVAHSLKGASGNISAKAMHATCLKIEQMAKDDQLDGLNSLLADLDRNFTDLKESIVEIKAEYKK